MLPALAQAPSPEVTAGLRALISLPSDLAVGDTFLEAAQPGPCHSAWPCQQRHCKFLKQCFLFPKDNVELELDKM